MTKADLTPERLREVLDYDPETGAFTWLKQLKHTRPIGSKAGTLRGNYMQIGIDQTRYYAHRLAWFWANGTWPEKQIDHINRNGLDNSILNLRDVSASANCRNTVRKNLHGQGVKKNKGHTWSAFITIDDGLVFLGNYLTAQDAEQSFLRCRDLHTEGPHAMRAFAKTSQLDAAKAIEATRMKIVVNGVAMPVHQAAKVLGVSQRAAYYGLKSGLYPGLQTSRT